MSLIKPISRQTLDRLAMVVAKGVVAKKRAQDEQTKTNDERRTDTQLRDE